MQRAYKGYLITKLMGGEYTVSITDQYGTKHHICYADNEDKAKQIIDSLT